MLETKIFFAQEFYEQYLSTINTIYFTNREIDVISCLLNARGTGKIAVFLSIDKRTVETHIRNIMSKIECNTREGIIDFIEVSTKILFLRKYYIILQNEKLFESSLKDIAKLNREKPPHCFLLQEQDKDPLTLKLKSHLELVGIKVSMGVREKKGDYTLFVFPHTLTNDISSSVLKKVTKSQNKVLLIQREKKNIKELPQELLKYDILYYEKQDNYFIFLFSVLKKILLNISLEKNIEEFKNKYKKPSSHETVAHAPLNDNQKTSSSVHSSWIYMGSLCLLFIFLGSGYLFFYGSHTNKVFIRSDLNVPSESALLNRSELMSQIKNAFKGTGGIQTVALVGIGGSGKTTLARQYAHQQKENLVWQINAETTISLIESFEALAYALATTEKDKGIFRSLMEIKNFQEREKKLVEFVKVRLKLQAHWLLIYDNVEKFTDIQKYYPLDIETWGQGKVILTTRDSTIQNNTQVNHTISIGELDKDQKLKLFSQILANPKNEKLTQAQVNETISFLEKIPPFPLDVSVAAYYLKTTNIPYAHYLEQLSKVDENFTSIQENILKGAGEYIKTRYGIITSSLEHLIKNHNDFADLLLFISLLDSQNIPRDLLTTYKSTSSVDNFVFHLKKYSLITNDSSSNTYSTFSIHRSTQDISFAYLAKILKLDQGNPLLKAIVYALDDYLSEAIEQEDFSKLQVMAQHLEKVLGRHDLFTDFYRMLLESKLGTIYYFINDDRFHQLLGNGLTQLPIENFSSEEKARISRSFLNMGAVYTGLRLDTQAQESFEKAVDIYGETGLKNYAELSWALSCLGNLHRRLKNYEKAREYLEQSIQLNKQHSGDKKRLSRTLAYLGSVYRGLGFYQKAIESLEESLALYNNSFSNDYFRIGWILTQLGNVYRELGSPAKAKECLESGLHIFQEHLPENHVDMGLALAYLGNYSREQGKYAESLEYLEKSLKIYNKYYDETHTRMGWLLYHLANTYKAMGKNQEAEKLFDKVLKIYATHTHKETLETGRLLREMAEISMGKNRLDDAENFIKRSLKIFQDHNHVDAYRSFEVLGEIYLIKSIQSPAAESQNLKSQALEAFNQALKIAEKNFPLNSVHSEMIRKKIKGE